MANNKYYGYRPKKDERIPNEGTPGSGNRLDRVNPYEFRKGMDYELTSMGCSRLAESTPEEREKATESVLKNLEGYQSYYSCLIHYETKFRNSEKKPTWKTWLKEFHEENNMKEVNRGDENSGHKIDKMTEPKYDKKEYTVPFKTNALKEAIKRKVKKALLKEQLDMPNTPVVGDDDDVLAKKATKGAKKTAKGTARFDKEIEAIEEFLYGKDKGEEKATADNPSKGSLFFLKDKHLEAYKIDKDVQKYKNAIILPDAIIKKLEKHIEKFGEGEKGMGNKVTLDNIKGKDIPETIKKLEARISEIKKEEEEEIAAEGREKNEIAATDMSRANHLRLLEICREHGVNLREGADMVKPYYEIAKQAFLEGVVKGNKL
jgi:hypothetical protein